jgi:DNA replication licensing factor MCM4
VSACGCYTDALQVYNRQHHSLDVDCTHVQQFDPVLYTRLIRYPQEVIPLFDLVASDTYRELFPDVASTTQLQVRTLNLGASKNMRDLNPEDVDQLISIKGIVIRTSQIIPDLRIGV